MRTKDVHESIAELKEVLRILVRIEKRCSLKDGNIKNHVTNTRMSLGHLIDELNKRRIQEVSKE